MAPPVRNVLHVQLQNIFSTCTSGMALVAEHARLGVRECVCVHRRVGGLREKKEERESDCHKGDNIIYGFLKYHWRLSCDQYVIEITVSIVQYY